MDEVKWDGDNPIIWNSFILLRQSSQIISLLSIKVYVLLIYTVRPVYESDFDIKGEIINLLNQYHGKSQPLVGHQSK